MAKRRLLIFLFKHTEIPDFLLDAITHLQDKNLEVTLYTRSKKNASTLPQKRIPLHMYFCTHLWFLGRWLIQWYIQKQVAFADYCLLEKKYYSPIFMIRKCLVFYPNRSALDVKKISQQINKLGNLHSHFHALSLLQLDDAYSTFYTQLTLPISTIIAKKNIVLDSLKPIAAMQPNTYFFCFVNRDMHIEDVFFVLRAFSKFKKRQQSSLKMLLFCEGHNISSHLMLDTYRYKDDVLVMEDCKLQDGQSIIRDAYAAIYSFDMAHTLDMAELAICIIQNTPIITISTIWTNSLMGKNVLYFYRTQVASLTDAMIQLFKDEQLRKRHKRLLHERKLIDSQYIASILKPLLA